MEVNQRTPFINRDLKPENNVLKRHTVSRNGASCVRYAVVAIVSLFGVAVVAFTYSFVKYYLLTNAAVDVDILEAKKCPGCVGQSICPAFFRGDVSFSGMYRARLAHLFHPASFGIQGTIGLYETAREVNLRRVGNPAPPDVVDAAVCRRGQQHGLPGSNQVARSKLRCIPHLAIWRWRPTNDPVEGTTGDTVDRPLYRGIVSAPVFEPPEDSDLVSAEEKWTQRVMPTAFSPATRCASDRLFHFLQSRFKERTSFGAETRWLRFDELMFLFNLAIDPQAVIWQAFPRTEGWPFPTYLGACGRWTIQDYHGVPLARFCGSPLWLRLRILFNILEVPDRLERATVAPTSTRTLGASEDPIDGYTIYLGNFDLLSLFTVDANSYNVTVANLRHAIIVDTAAASLYNPANSSEHTVHSNASTFVAVGLQQHKCEGNVGSSGDAGGTTPPCLKRAHADALCSHARSDHNYWAVCIAILSVHDNPGPCVDFLVGVPSELLSVLRTCVDASIPGSRRQSVEHAKDILLRTMKLHPEPKGW